MILKLVLVTLLTTLIKAENENEIFFRATDKNSNGELSYEELLNAKKESSDKLIDLTIAGKVKDAESLENEIAKVTYNVLKSRDRNQDGVLSFNELYGEKHHTEL